MADKKTFILHGDLDEKIKRLSRKEKGALLEALLAYANGEEPPDDMGALTKAVFDLLKPQLDSGTGV